MSATLVANRTLVRSWRCPWSWKYGDIKPFHAVAVRVRMQRENEMFRTRDAPNRNISTEALTSIQSDHIMLKSTPESLKTPANASVKEILSLNNRTIIVTGGARGLGATLASAVLEAGGDVVCLDVLLKPGESEWGRLVAICKDTNQYAGYHQCDITNQESVSTLMAEIASEASQRGKPIRGLVHCAGIQQMTDAIDYPIDEFKRILEVNVTGSFVMAQQIARIMRTAGDSGSIVLIASMSGHIANRV